MGNQQSHSKGKEGQSWSSWAPNEQEGLKKQLDQIKSSNSEGIPEYFSQDLYQCIISHLETKDTTQFSDLAHQFIKSRDANAISKVFQQAVEKQQATLEIFVTWVVTSAIPIWYESGTDYTWITLNDDTSKPLVRYILNYAHNLEKQKKDDMAWLNDGATSNKKDSSEESWEAKLSNLSQSEFVHWVEKTPAFSKLFQLVAEFIFLGKAQSTHKRRLDHLAAPHLQQHNKETRKLFGKNKFSSLLNPFDYYMLTLFLPGNALSWSDYEKSQRKVDKDVQHDLIFSSRRDGMSWQVFANKMVGQGATLIVIKTKDGAMFGGYTDEAWEYAKTDWYGNSSNFLFKLSPSYGTWSANSSNNHYQYLCWGKKSLPNGFGMGGQFEYAGLWIDADFIHGHSRAGPLCTTYSSPQLSTDDTFLVDEVEGKILKKTLNIFGTIKN